MLKKVTISLLWFLFFSSTVFSEEIKSYEVNIELQKDSSLLVEEKINYNFGGNYKHGIFRFIPNYFNTENQEIFYGFLQRKLKISDLKIFRNGQPEPIAELDHNDEKRNFFIKIGQKDKTFSGKHLYTIKYKVSGALKYFDDYTEINWNATGLHWPVPISAVEVNLTSEDNFYEFKKNECFSGLIGSSKKDCVIYPTNMGVVFKNKNLNSGEGLTIKVSLEKNSVPVVEFWGLGLFTFYFTWIFSILLIILIFIFFRKKYLDEFNPHDPIIPFYKPYEDFHPSLIGFIVDRKFNSRDITAGILSLAQKRIISIEKIKIKKFISYKDDYIFRLRKDRDKISDALDKFFVDLIFLKELDSWQMKSSTNFFGASTGIEEYQIQSSDLSREKRLSGFSSQSGKMMWQRRKINKKLIKYSKEEGFLEFSRFIKKIKSVREKYYEKSSSLSASDSEMLTILIIFLGFSGLFSLSIIIATTMPEVLLLFLVFFCLPILLMLKNQVIFVPRYTKNGWKLKNNIDGFKLFLEATEKERLKFFNAPSKNPKEFLEFLPYAVALGVSKEWEDQFENINIPQPDWYTGDGFFAVGSFSSNISSTLSSVSSSASSSGSSGSGGGSGGGGGGSW